ncbi:MAG: hypothetical protein H6907_04805 [Hyphomicrobiales bacterium]|nr:hypothetical protein [Hyphomicrobiales bacterium]MCP5371034.1 hypothetical protein [Hyphomicrobiales bacterium]
MALFRKKMRKIRSDAPPQDPNWVRDAAGRYHRLLQLDPEAAGLAGTGGVYVIWHRGMRPAWVFVGAADDLARALHDVAANPDVVDLESRGGLFVTWSLTHAPYRAGVVAYLTELMMPLVDNPAAVAADPVPVLPPQGT